MTPQLFDKLLSFVAEDLTRQHHIREPLEPGERLAIALSYLASGQDIKDVALAYRVGIETARVCIHVACRAIWARLKDHYMKKEHCPASLACDCLLRAAMFVTAACCGVPQKSPEPAHLEAPVIPEIPKCPGIPVTHVTP
ncbi:uncharacterized protein LOC119435724 isoform X2 [Dermacentor silvarum]|uniref:uncharacterized protein LOC119435724 isoform X2 n=1 Tax=Dermacentor silvarum TaxID=543639 RepID=UPI0021015F1A|nr:uncharacterized protein LOC119435724 isoform X2 [Dermacentor silvarum]